MSGSIIHRQAVIRERRGTALVLVLIAIVVLAVLSTGAILGSMQELRAAHNEQMSQRALTVAEYGLNQQLSNWTPARSQLANGAIDSSTVAVAAGDTASVKIMRLNGRTFWIVSIGRTNRSSGRLEAQRQVQLLVTLSGGVGAPATLTSYGNTTATGSAYITGLNTNPTGWTGCPPARDTFAIATNPAKNISVQKPATQSINGTYKDPNASTLTFFDTYGTDTFNSLAAAANVIASNSPNPTPVGSATTCTYGSTNWGEPDRSNKAVVGCQSYFPTIYRNGDLQVNGNSRGQGLLLVSGNLIVNGNFTFVGMIIVRGNIVANGNFTMFGAAFTQGDNDLSGNSSFYYSPCALSKLKVGGGASLPGRSKQRAWAQLYQ
jgi:hypothetical protein